MKKLFVKDDEELYLVVARYNNNDRLYVGIGNEYEELYGDITIIYQKLVLTTKMKCFYLMI